MSRGRHRDAWTLPFPLRPPRSAAVAGARRSIRRGVRCAALAALVAAAIATADATPAPPVHPAATVEPARRHLFYFHGGWIELHGLRRPHPRHGRYEQAEIVSALTERGFVVVADARLEPVEPADQARTVERSVSALLAQGVPARNITLVGHSKGARIVLLAASRLANPEIQYVILAGCQKPAAPRRPVFDRFLAENAAALAGRILSLYDRADEDMGTCREAFERAAPDRLESREVVFDTGRGHGLFYAPSSDWIDTIADWSAGAPPAAPRP